MNLKRIFAILAVLVFVIALVSGWFYWFQWRPSKIRKECYVEAKEKAQERLLMKIDIAPGEPSETLKRNVLDYDLYDKDTYGNFFEMCLQKKGLK